MNDILSESVSRVIDDIVMDQCGVTREQLTDEARFTEDFSADSLTKMDVGMAIETELELAIPDEALDGIVTVGDLRRAVARALDQRDTGGSRSGTGRG